MGAKFDPLLGRLREDDSINPSEYAKVNGVYPNMTVGGLVGKESDAIQDLLKSYIFRTTAGDNSISDGYARIIAYHGNVVNGVPFNANLFRGVGFNALSPENILEGFTIDASGSVVAEEGKKIAFAHVVACSAGSGCENGYVIRHKDGVEAQIIRVGFSSSIPSEGSTCTILEADTHGVSNSYLPSLEGYIWIATDNTTGLCAHLAWSGYRDAEVSEYEESSCPLPMCHTWGMAMAGIVYDEVRCLLSNNTRIIRKTTRTDRILLASMEWEEIETRHEPEVGEPYVTYEYRSADISELIRKSTTNLTYHNLSEACVVSVDEVGTVVISSGTTQMVPETDFNSYLYYELQTYNVEESNGDIQVYVWDFGTEEIIGNGVNPRAISTEYMTNYTDFIRNMYLNQSDDNVSVEKIIYEGASSTIYATDKNLLVKEIICFACNTPLLDGASLVEGSTITKDTVHSISVTMTDTNSIVILKTQSIS